MNSEKKNVQYKLTTRGWKMTTIFAMFGLFYYAFQNQINNSACMTIKHHSYTSTIICKVESLIKYIH